MTYYKYIIEDKMFETEGTYIYTLRPENESIQFIAGQYVFLKDPNFSNPEEEHPFSITSAPDKASLEFCIKQYGDWTESFAKRAKGNIVFVSEPHGEFVWDKDISYAVFLLGGIGISPIMSILRTLQKKGNESEIIMIYGNRTPETAAYEKELHQLENTLSNFKVIHVFSDIPDTHSWNGYRGFITKDIIEKEVDVKKNPMFFFIGPPIFTEKMHRILHEIGISQSQMKTENI